MRLRHDLGSRGGSTLSALLWSETLFSLESVLSIPFIASLSLSMMDASFLALWIALL